MTLHPIYFLIVSLLALIIVLLWLHQRQLYTSEEDVSALMQRAKALYRQEFGKEPPAPRRIIVRTARLPQKYVGNYSAASLHHADVGIITISDRIKDPQYRYWIIVHELIHSLMGKDCTGLSTEDCHDKDFQRMADLMGLPKKYQD